jgi:hypothetical protein
VDFCNDNANVTNVAMTSPDQDTHVTCVTFQDGTSKCFGKFYAYPWNGLLGCDLPTMDWGSTPGLGGGPFTVKKLVAGYDFVCALLHPTGQIKCMGNDYDGQLGNYYYTDYYASALGDDMPFTHLGFLGDLGGFVDIMTATGAARSWAVKSNGQIFGFGFPCDYNLVGYLDAYWGGDDLPALAFNANLGRRIVGAADATCVLSVAGKVRCWGMSRVNGLGIDWGVGGIGELANPMEVDLRC